MASGSLTSIHSQQRSLLSKW